MFAYRHSREYHEYLTGIVNIIHVLIVYSIHMVHSYKDSDMWSYASTTLNDVEIIVQ